MVQKINNYEYEYYKTVDLGLTMPFLVALSPKPRGPDLIIEGGTQVQETLL